MSMSVTVKANNCSYSWQIFYYQKSVSVCEGSNIQANQLAGNENSLLSLEDILQWSVSTNKSEKIVWSPSYS